MGAHPINHTRPLLQAPRRTKVSELSRQCGNTVYGASLPTTIMVNVPLSRPLRPPRGSAFGVVGSAADVTVVRSEAIKKIRFVLVSSVQVWHPPSYRPFAQPRKS